MDALDVVDWRRQVFAIYAEVRSYPNPADGHALWRKARDDLFAAHPASPLLPQARTSFNGLDVARYDPRWRFELPLRPAPVDRLELDTGTDGVVPFERLGLVEVPGLGPLDVWRLASYGGGLFLPVKDASAGATRGTYGGGRYLLDTAKGADLGGWVGAVVVDFNFAYNPSCAYDPAWACPLAQAGNTVATPIPVGERAAQ